MQKFDWQSVIKVNIFCLRIVGLWPKKYEYYKFDFYTFYATISLNFFIFANVLFQTINIIFIYSNVEALTETILLCVAEILAIVKIYTFIKNMKMLKRLMVSLRSEIFQPKNFKQILLVQPAINLWKMIFNSLLSAVAGAVVLWVVFPIWSGSTKNYALPFPAWYPFDIKMSPLYELTYLHQIISTFLLTLGDYNIDMLISALMMYVGAQCDILCENLKNLGVNSFEFKKVLKLCLLHHKDIIRFAKNCNDFFSFIIIGQFFTSSVCMAMALFRLALVTPSTFEFYTLLCSTMSLFMQIFTYCWFGDEVERKSNKISYAVFQSLWFSQPESNKKKMIIFIENAQFPIKLSAFRLFYLNLDIFVRILRSAVSYYTILRQISGYK